MKQVDKLFAIKDYLKYLNYDDVNNILLNSISVDEIKSNRVHDRKLLIVFPNSVKLFVYYTTGKKHWDKFNPFDFNTYDFTKYKF